MILTRRAILRASVSGALALICTARSSVAADGILYAAPGGQGAGGPGDPVSLGKVGKALSRGAFGTVAIEAPDAPWTWSGVQMRLDVGGRPETPLILRFVGPAKDDGPQFAMTGNETGPGERPDVGGRPFILLQPGASHLSIEGPTFHRAGGAGFFAVTEDAELTDLTISDIEATRAGRVIETRAGSRLSNVRISGCRAKGLIRGFARFRHLDDAVISDCDLDADLLDGGGGAVCQILSVVAGRNLRFENLRLARAVNELAAEERGSSYIQGDGIVLEEETSDIVISNCHAETMGDGGFDLKSRNVTIEASTARACKLGIRIWSPDRGNLIRACRVSAPVTRPGNAGACLWIGGTAEVVDTILETAPDTTAIRFGEGFDTHREEPEVTIRGGRIDLARGADLAAGKPGRIFLRDVALDGTLVSRNLRWTGGDLVDL